MTFANEKPKNNFKIFSNIEEEITKKNLNNQHDKEKLKINKSKKIHYPNKKRNYNYEITRQTREEDTNFDIYKTNTKKNINRQTNGNVKIKKSNKVYYPKDKTDTIKIQESNSEKDIWYNIKVYPTHAKDRFKKIKSLNKINTKIKKDFALIGPILEDNLGEITKALNIRGYKELEYIKIEQN